MDHLALLKKYNVAAPRYTSYPTVPYWENDLFSVDQWINSLKKSYVQNREEGLSLYIHLPFCESLCTYCGCNTRITKNHAVELPYIDAVLKEWEQYVSILGETPKIKEIHLGGGTPTFFSPANLSKLLNGILAGQSAEAECSFEGHPDNTTKEHLSVLRNLGFRRLSLGIQDFDPKVQFMINRFQSPQQVQAITGEARELGYESINFDLIYGLPGQTLAGLTETVLEVVKLRPDRIAFYSYAHVPWMKPGQRHFSEADIPSGEEKFNLYQAGRSILLNAGYEEIGMDHFSLKTDQLYKASKKGELHRNFMGYTHQKTTILIGLGVSSISDSYGAFAQNAKTVEAYLEKINKRELAVEKGHILNERDIEIRAHILDLMCRSFTKFDAPIPVDIIQRLIPLFLDKFVIFTDNSIRITEEGRPFLRNVCMALDERLWHKQPETKLFSTAV